MQVLESSEDYLERILILQQKNEHVKSIDLALDMGFSKPSISIAMKKLKEAGYIDILDHGYIVLTDKGYEIAEKIYERHLVLTKFLTSLGVSEEIAKKDACKIEHDISQESFDAIKSKI